MIPKVRLRQSCRVNRNYRAVRRAVYGMGKAAVLRLVVAIRLLRLVECESLAESLGILRRRDFYRLFLPFYCRLEMPCFGLGRGERVEAGELRPLRHFAGSSCVFDGQLAVAKLRLGACRADPGSHVVRTGELRIEANDLVEISQGFGIAFLGVLSGAAYEVQLGDLRSQPNRFREVGDPFGSSLQFDPQTSAARIDNRLRLKLDGSVVVQQRLLVLAG